MLSVSCNDVDEAKWRGFIDKNQMVWTRYFDRDHHVQRAFEVRAFPTYILIDAEGIVRFHEPTSTWEHTGSLPDASELFALVSIVLASLRGFVFPLMATLFDFGTLTHHACSCYIPWSEAKGCVLGCKGDDPRG